MYKNPDVLNLYRVKFHDKRGDVLRLDMNENPVGLPADFVEQVKEKLTPSFLSTYPEKDELMELIAAHNGVDYSNVTVTAGSDEAMRLTFQCFGEKGKDLITVAPTFEMYDVYSKMFGMGHTFIDYETVMSMTEQSVESTDAGKCLLFTSDAKAIADAINDNTGIIILLNPNSPIGTTYTEAEFRQIIETAAAHDALVVVDEAYHYFYQPTVMPLIREYDNLIVFRTFSKLCSIAGLRVGYAVSNPANIEMLENAESTFNVNNVGILFATEILKDTDMMEQLRLIEAEGRAYITEALLSAGYQVNSAEGNYVLFKPHTDSKTLVANMKSDGVWIRDYGRGILAGWCRISTGDKDSMMRCMECIEKWDRQ